MLNVIKKKFVLLVQSPLKIVQYAPSLGLSQTVVAQKDYLITKIMNAKNVIKGAQIVSLLRKIVLNVLELETHHLNVNVQKGLK